MLHFLKKIFSPFAKIKSHLGSKIRALFSRNVDENSYAELEELLYEADLGPAIAMDLVQKIRSQKPAEVLPFIKSELLKLFP